MAEVDRSLLLPGVGITGAVWPHHAGSRSQVKSATTTDFVVGAPENFTITAEGERALKLVWDEVAEGRDAASITGYRIERTTDAGDDMSFATRQTNRRSSPYVETDLAPDTYYCYRVAAITRVTAEIKVCKIAGRRQRTWVKTSSALTERVDRSF